MSNSFPQLKNRIIRHSSLISQNLARLSSASPTDNEQIDSLTSTIESQLNEFKSQINDAAASFPAKQPQLNRFRAELQQHQSDFYNLSTKIANERHRSQLFTHNTDITSDSDQHATQLQNDAYFLDERARVDNSHAILDAWISQAAATRDEIFRQNGVLDRVGGSLDASLQRIPALNSLLSRISDRRKRNSIVLASVILVAAIILWLSL